MAYAKLTVISLQSFQINRMDKWKNEKIMWMRENYSKTILMAHIYDAFAFMIMLLKLLTFHVIHKFISLFLFSFRIYGMPCMTSLNYMLLSSFFVWIHISAHRTHFSSECKCMAIQSMFNVAYVCVCEL